MGSRMLARFERRRDRDTYTTRLMKRREDRQWQRDALQAIDRSKRVLLEVEETQARVREALRRSYEIDRRRGN